MINMTYPKAWKRGKTTKKLSRVNVCQFSKNKFPILENEPFSPTESVNNHQFYFKFFFFVWGDNCSRYGNKFGKQHGLWESSLLLSLWHNVKMRMVFWHAHIRAIFPSDQYTPCILSNGIFLDLWTKQTEEERKNTRSHRSIRKCLTTCCNRLVSIRPNYQLPNNNDSQNTHSSQKTHSTRWVLLLQFDCVA